MKVKEIEFNGSGTFVVTKNKITATKGKIKSVEYDSDRLIVEGITKFNNGVLGKNNNFGTQINGVNAIGNKNVSIVNGKINNHNMRGRGVRINNVSGSGNAVVIGYCENMGLANDIISRICDVRVSNDISNEEYDKLPIETAEYELCLEDILCNGSVVINLDPDTLNVDRDLKFVNTEESLISSTNKGAFVKFLHEVKIKARGQSENKFFDKDKEIADNVRIIVSGQSKAVVASMCLKTVNVECSGQSCTKLVGQSKCTKMIIDSSDQSTCNLKKCIVPGGSSLTASCQSSIKGSSDTKACGTLRKRNYGQSKIKL